MKKCFFVLLSIFVTFFAGGQLLEAQNNSPLVGNWVNTETNNGVSTTTMFYFHSDGTFQSSFSISGSSIHEATGTWSIDGDSLIVNQTTQLGQTQKIKFAIDPTTHALSLFGPNNLVLTFRRN